MLNPLLSFLYPDGPEFGWIKQYLLERVYRSGFLQSFVMIWGKIPKYILAIITMLKQNDIDCGGFYTQGGELTELQWHVTPKMVRF